MEQKLVGTYENIPQSKGSKEIRGSREATGDRAIG
jgi:hypothetical protein